MKLMFPKFFRVGAFVSVAALIVICAGGSSAQSRKQANSKKAVAKKAEKQSKDAKKGKPNAKDRIADAKSKKDPKKASEAKKAAAERRRNETARTPRGISGSVRRAPLPVSACAVARRAPARGAGRGTRAAHRRPIPSW